VDLSSFAILAFLPVLLTLSAFASSSETALFSLDRFQLRNLRERHKKAYFKIKKLLEHPTRLLIVILIINEIANLSIANVITRFVDANKSFLSNLIGGPFLEGSRSQTIALTLATMLIGAPITLIFGEISPKIVAARMNKLVAVFNSRILNLVYNICYPLLVILDATITFVLKSFGAKGVSHLSKFLNPLDEADFVELLEEAHKEGSLEPSERRLIHKVFRLDDVRCSQIMKPLSETFMLEANSSIGLVMHQIEKEKYSRIPIFSKVRKNIVGVLYVKDLVKSSSLRRVDDRQNLIKDIMVKPMMIPASTNLSALLRKFKRSKMHLAIVLDKNHEAAGIITLEDVLENIFGDIEDERDIIDG
jgi:CBS domain containing-hemolysin-like protein